MKNKILLKRMNIKDFVPAIFLFFVAILIAIASFYQGKMEKNLLTVVFLLALTIIIIILTIIHNKYNLSYYQGLALGLIVVTILLLCFGIYIKAPCPVPDKRYHLSPR